MENEVRVKEVILHLKEDQGRFLGSVGNSFPPTRDKAGTWVDSMSQHGARQHRAHQHGRLLWPLLSQPGPCFS